MILRGKGLLLGGKELLELGPMLGKFLDKVLLPLGSTLEDRLDAKIWVVSGANLTCFHRLM